MPRLPAGHRQASVCPGQTSESGAWYPGTSCSRWPRMTRSGLQSWCGSGPSPAVGGLSDLCIFAVCLRMLGKPGSGHPLYVDMVARRHPLDSALADQNGTATAPAGIRTLRMDCAAVHIGYLMRRSARGRIAVPLGRTGSDGGLRNRRRPGRGPLTQAPLQITSRRGKHLLRGFTHPRARCSRS